MHAILLYVSRKRGGFDIDMGASTAKRCQWVLASRLFLLVFAAFGDGAVVYTLTTTSSSSLHIYQQTYH